MKANELRIGNKIIGNDVYSGEVKTFERFNHDLSVVFFSDGSPSGIGEFLKDCSGVPLTEERLIRFGFKLIKNDNPDPSDWYFSNDVLSLSYGSFTVHGRPKAPCKFAHQLQNLYFALTGEELPLANQNFDTEKTKE